MKTIRFIILTSLLAFNNFSFGQTGLFINDSTAFFSADTIAQGNSLVYSIQITNGGPSITYTGDVTIQIYNDSLGSGGFGNIIPIDSAYIQGATISANSSISYTDSLTVDPANFKSGINTVVIWPVASNASGFITLDTIRYNIFVLYPLANKETQSMDKIILYPNPFSSKIWFKGLAKNSIEQVRILNVLGEEIKQLRIKETSPLDLSDLQKGIYFIKLQSKDGIQIIIKTIKE
ncbi:MAG: T9SS type A sorting domain-containing protein [Bacteroidia bacterium]